MDQQAKQDYCHIYVVRHGQTEWNTKKIMQGHLDSPLTQQGIRQAQETAQLLRKVNFKQIFSSDLYRAQHTAEIIAADKDIAVKTTRLLRESDLGPFQGKKLEFFRAQLREAIEYRDSLTDEEQMLYQIHPQVESYEQVASRMLRFMREVAVVNKGDNVLLTSHAGAIRATLVKLGFASNKALAHGSIGNASYAVIDSDGVDFFVKKTHGITLSESGN